MRPFTFYPGPRLMAGEALHERLAELLPEGPCLLGALRRTEPRLLPAA